MKSPPFLIAVLIACVFVLGINYWITSTRCVELQRQVMELEGRIRRAAAERGAVEMKKNEFEDMLEKQKRQIDTIQSLHSSQIQNVHLFYKSEKENLLSNLTNKDNNIQNLQAEIANVQKQLEESKLDFKELQESQAKKSFFELTQCSNKLAEVKEQCEEKIRRLSAKDANAVNDDEDKATSLTKKIKPVTSKQDINQKVIGIEEQKLKGVIETAERPSEYSKKEAAPPPNKEQTKKVNVVVEEKKPSSPPQQVKVQEEKDKKEEEEEEEARNEVNPNLANADEEDDELKVEDVEDPNKDIENYEVERENLINMDGQPEEKGTKPIQQDIEGKNDYNGDEANEAESETEKEVELGNNDQNLRGKKSEKELYELSLNQQAEEGDDPRLK